MDVVKLWSSLLANCAIGPTTCTTIPTAYFVQGTADVQFFGYANNDNNVNTQSNNETYSIADSDSNSSCFDKRQGDVVTVAADAEDGEQDEEGEDEEQDDDEEDDEEEEEDDDNQPDQHLIPVKIVDELVDGSGGDVRVIEVTTGEPGERQRKHTQGKQTQTKIHRNRYSREEYRCSMCPYTCTTEKAFLKHSRNCEPKDQNDTDNKQLSLSCPICGKDRRGEESLVLHMKKHKDNKHFCCDICIFKTLQLKKLIQHRRMHTGEKPHLCPFCSYRSARRDNLRSHARRVHKKDNLPCDTFTPRSMILRPSQSK